MSPLSGTSADSATGIPLSGYVTNPYAGTHGVTLYMSAWNWTWSTFDQITTATVAANATPVMNAYVPLYAWQTAQAVSLPDNYWAPQYSSWSGTRWQDTNVSQGHLLLTVDASSNEPLGVINYDQAPCADSAQDIFALNECTLGDTLVLDDQNGVDQGAPSYSQWTQVPDIHGTTVHTYAPPGERPVTWEVDTYPVDGHTVYNFLCKPVDTRPIWQQHVNPAKWPVQIYNHGSFGGINGVFYDAGLTVDSGVGSGEDGSVDELGICLSGAQNGWLVVASSYRGEHAVVDTAPKNAGTHLYRDQMDAGQDMEFCLGEVTDALALTDLVRQHPNADTARVLMWGWSHGGCVTQRAVQQGAQVKAAATFSAVVDEAEYFDYMGNFLCGGPKCSAPEQTGWAHLHGPDGGNTPETNPLVYSLRDPLAYETWTFGNTHIPTADPGNLRTRPDIPFLMIQGGSDRSIPSQPACALSAAIGSSCSNWFVPKPSSAKRFPTDCADAGILAASAWQDAGAPANWNANWNFVWVEDAPHTSTVEPDAWSVFHDFVASLNWGVGVPPTPLITVVEANTLIVMP
jgi:hypothetical protein